MAVGGTFNASETNMPLAFTKGDQEYANRAKPERWKNALHESCSGLFPLIIECC